MKKDITELFCNIDDFCQAVDAYEKSTKIGNSRKPTRTPELTISECMTIQILYHQSPCKNFKYFYKCFLQLYKSEFPKLVSYERFVELIPRMMPYFYCLMKSILFKDDSINFIDSTPIPVCNNKRIKRHQVFKKYAKRGKTSMGWFFGLKLHLVINRFGEIADFCLTSGNCDDRAPVSKMTENLNGLLIGDKGYISQEIFKYLHNNGLKLITGIKKNMKNMLISLHEKSLLRKRSIIETVFDYLKNKMEISHTRHRSPINGFIHIFSTLVAYTLNPRKPKISPIF